MPIFRVEVEFYQGPLDLLVVLVRQGEVDVLELMIGEITRRFVESRELDDALDMEEVGEFLILASSLMEIKSRQLLPQVEPGASEHEAEGVKEELVRQLMEYRRFREAASLLAERAIRQRDFVPRLADDLPASAADAAQAPIRELELWDLVSAFSRLMRENIVPVADAIERDPTPLPVYMNRLEATVLSAGDQGISFRDLLGLSNTRSQIIGKFLATLELIKTRRVWVEFDARGEEILFFPPREAALDAPMDEMAMADTSVPPDALPPGEQDESDPYDTGAADLLARLNPSGPEELAEADEESAWAGFEPMTDEDEDPQADRDDEVDFD